MIYAADTVDPVGLDFEREDQKENARKTKNPDNPRFYEKIQKNPPLLKKIQKNKCFIFLLDALNDTIHFSREKSSAA